MKVYALWADKCLMGLCRERPAECNGVLVTEEPVEGDTEGKSTLYVLFRDARDYRPLSVVGIYSSLETLHRALQAKLVQTHYAPEVWCDVDSLVAFARGNSREAHLYFYQEMQIE